ncbi:unnamed protein product [Brassica napus]|uniref:(rape) hypothetical protein n=1 Tax=Brassica napus TaxID=3708 RepID=A0A816PTD6_BRANA|nr:unnamed protein product [Brassica napus]
MFKQPLTDLCFPSSLSILYAFKRHLNTSCFLQVLSIDPVIGAISAGNGVLLKPLELAPASSSLLAKLLEQYLDPCSVRVVAGAVTETTLLLEQKWDKIFYTDYRQAYNIRQMGLQQWTSVHFSRLHPDDKRICSKSGKLKNLRYILDALVCLNSLFSLLPKIDALKQELEAF